MNRNVKSFERTVFLSKQCVCVVPTITTTIWSAVFQPWHRPTIMFPPLVCCPVDNTLFEVSPEIRCSGLRVRQVTTVAVATTQLVLSQFENFFYHINWELNKVSLSTKKRCQSNLTKSASRGPIPRLGVTPGGRKLYHWIPGVGFPISVP